MLECLIGELPGTKRQPGAKTLGKFLLPWRVILFIFCNRADQFVQGFFDRRPLAVIGLVFGVDKCIT